MRHEPFSCTLLRENLLLIGVSGVLFLIRLSTENNKEKKEETMAKDKILLGLTGEYYVAAKLSSLGLKVAPAAKQGCLLPNSSCAGLVEVHQI
jgi:hypothetical protein